MSRLILILLLSCPVMLAADELTRLIPPATESITGVDVSRLRTNPRWPLLFEIARLWRPFEDSSGATGFDPTMHLDELVLLDVGGDSAGELVVLRGRFDASRIARFDRRNSEGHETRYRGVRVCAPLEADGEYLQWTAAIADMVVIGPAEAVRVAIDAYLAPENARPVNWFDRGLARVRGRYGAWAVARSVMGNQSSRDVELSGGLRLDTKPTVEGEAITSSQKDADELGKLVRDRIAGDWRMQGSRLWKTAVESVRISTDQRTLRVTAEMDWEPLLLLMAAGSRRFY